MNILTYWSCDVYKHWTNACIYTYNDYITIVKRKLRHMKFTNLGFSLSVLFLFFATFRVFLYIHSRSVDIHSSNFWCYPLKRKPCQFFITNSLSGITTCQFTSLQWNIFVRRRYHRYWYIHFPNQCNIQSKSSG